MFNLSVTPFSVDQAKELASLDEVKYLVIGANLYGLRQVRDFSIEEIKEMTDLENVEICVSVNKIMHQSDREGLKEYLQELNKIGVDYIIFSDFMVLMLVRELKLDLKLIYNTETTITNTSFTKMANTQGISGVELAKEITLKEIEEISKVKECMISCNIHGHIYMYQSVRRLVSNFAEFQDMTIETNNLKLYDEERDLYYPLIENKQGTHVLAGRDLCMINRLNKIVNIDVDMFKIDGFLYEEEVYLKIVKLYIEAKNELNKDPKTNLKPYFEKIKSLDTTKSYNTGFYFKETIY